MQGQSCLRKTFSVRHWNQTLERGIILLSPTYSRKLVTERRDSAPTAIRHRRSAMASATNLPNHLLASLSPDDSDLLRPHLRQDDLTLGSVLFRPGEQIDRVYFPAAGIISLVVPLSDGYMVEAGMFG